MKDLLYARFDNETSDRSEGKTPPPFELEKFKRGEKILLLGPDEFKFPTKNLDEILNKRKTLRVFLDEAITFEEISIILYYTYGNRQMGKSYIRKFVPSAGERYGEELFIIAFNVENLDMGVYYYSPAEHALYVVSQDDQLNGKISEISKGQEFIGQAQLFLFLVAVPPRLQYAYPNDFAKLALLDAGHIFQQAILLGESLDIGSCPIGKYDQEKMDQLLQLSEDEVAIYGLTMGKED